jgi:hypothetical protein
MTTPEPNGASIYAEALVATAVAVLVLAMLPLDLLAPAAAQRVVFTAWLGWTVLAAGGHRKAGMP